MKKCPFPEVTELQNRQIYRIKDREKDTKRKALPDRPSLFWMCSTPLLGGERDDFKRERRADHEKQREKQRVAVSEERKRAREREREEVGWIIK